jgi:beta-lactamase regulating signal transducer with metallopeptidase domain
MTLDLTALGAAAGSWILTYLLHSTLLLACATLAMIALRTRPEIEEAIWKLALVGGLLTASLQPAVGAWRATGGMMEDPAALTYQVAPAGVGAPALLVPPTLASSLIEAVRVMGTGTPRSWLIAGWVTVAFLLLARLLAASLRLRRRLAGRRMIAGGPLAHLVERLRAAAGRRAPVRLTRTVRIPVPIALSREICLPERALCELPPNEQESVVAHEMAHVLRHDPLWLLAGRVLAALFFFHPLVLLAGRRLRLLAELRCDDWAAAATGRPLALARCLTRVASWGGEGVPVAAMAGDRRSVAGRVTRLLEHDRTRRPGKAPRWLRPAAAVGLLVVACWVPGVSLAGEPVAAAPEAPPEPPVALAVAPPLVAAPVPAAAPVPVVAPVPPAAARPAVAIPPPGPFETDVSAVLAEERARLEAEIGLSAEERDRLVEDSKRLAADLRERLQAERHEFDRQRLQMGQVEREELRRLARELAGQKRQMAEQMAEHRQIVADEARQLAEQARRTIVVEQEALRELRRNQAQEMDHLAEEMRKEARRELERLGPELERLRLELRLRTEEREQLRREVEALRRQLEASRDKD